MFKHNLKDTFKSWLNNISNQPGKRWAAGLIAALISTVMQRRPIYIFFNEGVWVYKYADMIFVANYLSYYELPTDHMRRLREGSFYVYRPKPGDIIFDIGASLGENTYSFSKVVGSRGKVISIEASPPIFFCLSKFCKYNDLKNVTLINAAICEKEQEVIVGGSGEASRISNSGNGFKVKGTTLDLIVKSLGIDMIDFIYMNIEGAEKMAIQGMTDCIKKTKNICISCHDFLANSTGGEHYRSKNDVLEFLKKNNFRIITNENHEAASIRDILYGVNQEL